MWVEDFQPRFRNKGTPKRGVGSRVLGQQAHSSGKVHSAEHPRHEARAASGRLGTALQQCVSQRSSRRGRRRGFSHGLFLACIPGVSPLEDSTAPCPKGLRPVCLSVLSVPGTLVFCVLSEAMILHPVFYSVSND